MNAIVEAFASFLGFLGWLMVGIALPNRYWKVSTVDGNVITTSTIYENLWMSCATDSTGVHNCRDFPSLLALDGTCLGSFSRGPLLQLRLVNSGKANLRKQNDNGVIV